MSVIDVMDKRVSVRTYSTEDLSHTLMERVKRIVEKERKGPFGNRYSMKLFNPDEVVPSYGVIKGASLFFGGLAGTDERAIIDYGYCFEEVVLELTALELGTCWLGGTFSRDFIASQLDPRDGFITPAISPIGYSAEKTSMADKISRVVANAKKRKAHHKIFFNYTGEGELQPLRIEELAPPVDEICETVRFAPSASNKQPWRIVRQNDHYHFYCHYDKKYNALFRLFQIQSLDMGIALCHFKKSAEELRLGGTFSYSNPHLENVGWNYILSWKSGR